MSLTSRWIGVRSLWRTLTGLACVKPRRAVGLSESRAWRYEVEGDAWSRERKLLAATVVPGGGAGRVFGVGGVGARAAVRLCR